MENNQSNPTILVLRCFSLYLFIKAINTIADNLTYYSTHDFSISVVIFAVIFPVLLFITAGCVLWNIAPTVAKKIISNDARSEGTDFQQTDFYNIGFSIVGLFVLVNAIPEIIYWLIHFAQSMKDRPDTRLAYWLISLTMGKEILKIAIGIWLLFGSKALVRFVMATRRN